MDGNIKQLSNYNQTYEFANVMSPIWSPDNIHIGFWIKIGDVINSNPDEMDQQLAIINTDTLETKIYCLTYGIASYAANPIIWSPDGRNIIANTRLPNGDVEIILVDLIQNTKSALNGTKGFFAEDWMSP
jgi:hypothetical protein